jgi:hypothetical protein
MDHHFGCTTIHIVALQNARSSSVCYSLALLSPSLYSFFSTQLSSDTFLEVAKILSTNEYWTLVGSKLGLMTFDDINYFRSNPVKGGNGSEVLQRWQESNLTYRDLVNALKDVNLNRAADVIEKHYQKPRTMR